jgi:predicted RNA-binding protein (virulence factor B family)
MLQPGYRYQLSVATIDQRGAWLCQEQEKILLPRSQCPAGLEIGQKIEVFLYHDRGRRLTATTNLPQAQVGEFALLQVKTVDRHGAFLDWGLEKDLLAPYREQQEKMLEGRRYLVRICLDEQQRPYASSRLDSFLQDENIDLAVGDEVDILIRGFTELGAKVIVADRYNGVLYRDEVPPGLKRGERCSGYVQKIRPDQRIDVSLRRPGAAGAQDARQIVLAALQTEGFLALHDQSSPEQIRQQLGLSKKAFKKAVGSLYKEKKIELRPDGIVYRDRRT